MKKILQAILPHLCFWRGIADEAKYSVKSVLPLVIALALPLVYPSLISLTYSNQTVVERPVVVLDLDNSQISRDLLVAINGTQGADITRFVDSIDEGVQAVISREADVFLFVPEDFSSNIKSFRQGNLKAYVYATNMMTYAAAMTGVQLSVLGKNIEIATEQVTAQKGITGERAVNVLDPIRYEEHMMYSPALAYSSYVSPMLFIIVFHQMGLLILAFSIGYHREKDEKFKKRKLWFIDYFWRYLFYYFFIALGTITVYKFICPLFGWPNANPEEMMKLILLLVFCQIPMSIVLASVCKDRFTSFQFILGLSLVFFTMSGYVWPRYAMPEWVKTVTDYLGVVPTASAMRRIAFKGGTLADCGPEICKLLELFKLYLVISLIFVHRDLPVRFVKRLFTKKHTDNPPAETQNNTLLPL